MRTIEVLKAARALIADPKNWLKFELKNGEGGFCARGAIVEVAGGYHQGDEVCKNLFEAMLPSQRQKSETYLLLFRSIQSVPWTAAQHVAGFNNSSTHEEVLDLFDLAIARQLVIDSMAHDSLVETIVNAPVYLEDIMQRADKAALLVGV